MTFPTYGSVFACILLSSVFMIVVCLLEVPDLRETEEKYAKKGTGTSGDRAFEKGVSGHGMFTGL